MLARLAVHVAVLLSSKFILTFAVSFCACITTRGIIFSHVTIITCNQAHGLTFYAVSFVLEQ